MSAKRSPLVILYPEHNAAPNHAEAAIPSDLLHTKFNERPAPRKFLRQIFVNAVAPIEPISQAKRLEPRQPSVGKSRGDKA